MKERPIIFSGPMVRSLISGIKTQTRRIAKDQSGIIPSNNPYGHAGDLLWVKESWRTLSKYDMLKPTLIPINASIEYKADQYKNTQEGMSEKWRTPLFIQKRFSRLELVILNVRYEKLMACTELDAMAEGVGSIHVNALAQYKAIWEGLHGLGSWEKNPWVWVIEFRRNQVKM